MVGSGVAVRVSLEHVIMVVEFGYHSEVVLCFLDEE